jgi:MHS family proline/betaine transporter-like MFS transporter
MQKQIQPQVLFENARVSASYKSGWREAVAALVGNTLEWFDIGTYGMHAVTIGRVFFPSADRNVSLMLAFGTFGIAYMVRPLGAIVLGAYADRSGRKKSMMLSLT